MIGSLIYLFWNNLSPNNNSNTYSIFLAAVKLNSDYKILEYLYQNYHDVARHRDSNKNNAFMIACNQNSIETFKNLVRIWNQKNFATFQKLEILPRTKLGSLTCVSKSRKKLCKKGGKK